MAAKEFGEHTSPERSNTPVIATGKAIQWNSLRYMLSEVSVIFELKNSRSGALLAQLQQQPPFTLVTKL